MRRQMAFASVILPYYCAATFVPGAVCNGVDANGLASGLLVGKHLRVIELEWAPFAVKDDSAPYP